MLFSLKEYAGVFDWKNDNFSIIKFRAFMT